MVFLNRGDHLEAVSLPAEAQLAPAFYAGIADFDGDGNEDVFLSQNFYPTAVGLPRYDTGRGLLLKGDGKGGLRPMPGQDSGLLVYGDQRGAAYADYDGDGRLGLAGSPSRGPALPQSGREAGSSGAPRGSAGQPGRHRRSDQGHVRRPHGTGARGPGGVGLLVGERRGAGVRSLRRADGGVGPLARRRRDPRPGGGRDPRSDGEAMSRRALLLLAVLATCAE